MDEACYNILLQLRLPDIHLISLEAFESDDMELLNSKQNRSLLEYYFTCTPSLPLFILDRNPAVDVITYLDADLFFFQDPQPIYAEMGDSSIAIIEHRFPPHLADRIQYGIYNVGWLSFRRDNSALTCLHWWRERCLEYCHDVAQDGRFADQKYLDDWPKLFQKVVVLQHKGANLAPWNLANYHLQTHDHHLWVDEQLLIFFHFHGLRRIADWLYDPNLSGYGVKLSKVVRHSIFEPYLQAMLLVSKQLECAVKVTSLPRGAKGPATHPSHQFSNSPRYIISKTRGIMQIGKALLTRQYIFVLGGHTI